jgi:hypothetical protein
MITSTGSLPAAAPVTGGAARRLSSHRQGCVCLTLSSIWALPQVTAQQSTATGPGLAACWSPPYGTVCFLMHCRDGWLAALASGTTVIVDRYAYSGVAYSAAKGVRGARRLGSPGVVVAP